MCQKFLTHPFVCKVITHFKFTILDFSDYLKYDWQLSYYFAKISFVFCKFE